MIFVTGDTHGDRDRFRLNDIKKISSGDTLIVCGDFGYIFSRGESEEEYLNFLAALPFCLVFVDGNHENFDRLESYPVEMWNGGKVHVIRRDGNSNPKVIHLMRGQIFEIEGKKIFTFGGGYSIDKNRRMRGYSWWEREMPTDAEMNEAICNLKENDYAVDYIITHTAPEETMSIFHPFHEEEKRLNNFLEWIRESTQYQQWFFGHLHRDEDFWRNQTVLWSEIRNIETNQVINIAR